MTSFYPESGPGMPFAICPERMCLTEQIPLGSVPSVLLHGGPRMCPVLEIPEGLCVYHGLYRGVGCPGCEVYLRVCGGQLKGIGKAGFRRIGDSESMRDS